MKVFFLFLSLILMGRVVSADATRVYDGRTPEGKPCVLLVSEAPDSSDPQRLVETIAVNFDDKTHTLPWGLEQDGEFDSTGVWKVVKHKMGIFGHQIWIEFELDTDLSDRTNPWFEVKLVQKESRSFFDHWSKPKVTELPSLRCEHVSGPAF